MSEQVTASEVARALLQRDSAAQALGIEIEHAERDRAVLGMPVMQHMCNGMGVCHGGMIFTLADTAMAYASNSHNRLALASTASIDYMRVVRPGSRMRATAVAHFRGRRKASYEVVVEDEAGNKVAHFHGTVAIVDRPVVTGREEN